MLVQNFENIVEHALVRAAPPLVGALLDSTGCPHVFIPILPRPAGKHSRVPHLGKSLRLLTRKARPTTFLHSGNSATACRPGAPRDLNRLSSSSEYSLS